MPNGAMVAHPLLKNEPARIMPGSIAYVEPGEFFSRFHVPPDWREPVTLAKIEPTTSAKDDSDAS